MAFTSKSDLVGYYMEKLNAVEITPRRMVIFEEAAQMLLDKYMRKQVVIMLAMERKPVDFTHDISYYAKASRLTEGCALYLTNGEPFYRDYIEQMGIPTYKETCSNNPLTFSNCGGYTYANTYIEYIENVYGWNAVLKIIESEDYEEVFGKSKEDIYDEWVEYIREYYQ